MISYNLFRKDWSKQLKLKKTSPKTEHLYKALSKKLMALQLLCNHPLNPP